MNEIVSALVFGGSKGEKGDPGVGAEVVQTTGQAADVVMSQKAVTDELADKAKVDGYYEPLSVGLADNLVDRNDPGIARSFSFDTACGDASISDVGNGIIKSIRGKTLKFRQYKAATGFAVYSRCNYTKSEAGVHKLTATATGAPEYAYVFGISNDSVLQGMIGHKILISYVPIAVSDEVTAIWHKVSNRLNSVAIAKEDIVPGKRVSLIGTIQSNESYILQIGYSCANGTLVAGAWFEFMYPMIFDLTETFGAGNEPSASEFDKMFSNEYYTPTGSISLLNFTGTGIKTVGFNQMNASGKVNVLTGHEYEVVGTKTGLTYADGTSITLTDNKFTADRTGEVTVTGFDGTTCVHLTWSGYRNGEHEPYWENTLDLPISTYFPDGMKSGDNVYDELLPDKAIQRCEIVNGAVVVLDSPVETPIDPPLNLTYKVADFGTEELIPVNGSEPTTTPFSGIISYSTNFTREVANMPKNYQSKDSMDALLSALGTACGGTFTKAWDATNRKWAYTFTPAEPVATE